MLLRARNCASVTPGRRSMSWIPRTYDRPSWSGWPDESVVGTVKEVVLADNACEWTTSFVPLGSVIVLSKIVIRTASALKPAGIVKVNVGVSPLPEIVTLCGKGTGFSAPASVGVLVVAESGPLVNVRFQEPSREELNGGEAAQKFGLTARGAHVTGPTVIPWTAVSVDPPLGMMLAPNWFLSPWPIPTSLRPRVSLKLFTVSGTMMIGSAVAGSTVSVRASNSKPRDRSETFIEAPFSHRVRYQKPPRAKAPDCRQPLQDRVITLSNGGAAATIAPFPET